MDRRTGFAAIESVDSPTGVRRRLLDRAIDLFLVLWLFSATNAIIPLLVMGDARALTPEDNALLRLLIVPAIAIAPVLVLARHKAMTSLLLRNPTLVLLLLWVWCSALWSFAPDLTLRRALSLTVFTLLACYLVVRHDFDWILVTLAWISLVLLVASLFFILFLPSLGAMPGGRGLRGIYTHKNGMGALLVMVAIVLPPAIKKRLVNPLLGWIGLLVAVLLLIPVGSATAIVVVLVVLATNAVLAVWRLPTRLAAAVTALVLAALCFMGLGLALNLDMVFEALGRDASFTGRTDLWAYVWLMIERRPLTGYGYGAFWEVETFAGYSAAAFRWEVPNAHDGYLDLLLGIGAVGMALFSIFIGSALVRAVVAFDRLDPQLVVVTLTLVVGYALRGTVESTLLVQNSIMWVLVVVFTVSLTPNLAAIRDRR